MKATFRVFVLLLGTCFSMTTWQSVQAVEDAYLQNLLGPSAAQREAIYAFNEQVTDQDIVDWFELFLKYQTDDLMEFRNHSDSERQEFLQNYRFMHNQHNMKIPTLKGMTEAELEEMQAWARFAAEESRSVDNARQRLHTFSNQQYLTIRDSGTALIKAFTPDTSNSSRQIIRENLPKALAFIQPMSIYVHKNNCRIFLHKGIGRGIGYSIAIETHGEVSLSWFDEYEAWGSTPIELSD